MPQPDISMQDIDPQTKQFDSIEGNQAPVKAPAGDPRAMRALVGWITTHTDEWKDWRDNNVSGRWGEYWSLWKGEFSEQLRNRKSERSRLIAPALQQAVDSGVAEIVEAVFGKGNFFDVDVPPGDTPSEAMEKLRDNLIDDMKFVDVRSACTSAFFNGGLFGTLIGKLSITKEKVFDNILSAEPKVKTVVRMVPVRPDEFVIDPSATCVEDALGMAHMTEVPKHTVISKMKQGIYFETDLGDMPNSDSSTILPQVASKSKLKSVTSILEYHGLVPKELLDAVNPKDVGPDEEVVHLVEEPGEVEGPDNSEWELEEPDNLVESIVTIANGAILLRANENPLWMKDRAFILAQYEQVPGQIWGRGIAEKAFNPQKALDAELRGRIDAMAYSIHPLSAMDATKLPPGFKFEVSPGKNLLTMGPPEQAIKLFNFTGPDPASFSQSGDLERMVQMATGTPDSSASVATNPRNSTATGMSMIAAGVLKRTKNVLGGIERKFMDKLVTKLTWRYMQFDPERYPRQDIKFRVFTTLGIMAREFEQTQLTQLLQTTAPNTPAYWLLMKGIYENSSITNKEQMLAAIEKQMQASNQPSQEQQLAVQKAQMDMQDKKIQRMLEARRVAVEELRASIELAKLPSAVADNEASAVLSLAKAEAQKLQRQIQDMDAMMKEWENQVVVPTVGAPNEPR